MLPIHRPNRDELYLESWLSTPYQIRILIDRLLPLPLLYLPIMNATLLRLTTPSWLNSPIYRRHHRRSAELYSTPKAALAQSRGQLLRTLHRHFRPNRNRSQLSGKNTGAARLRILSRKTAADPKLPVAPDDYVNTGPLPGRGPPRSRGTSPRIPPKAKYTPEEATEIRDTTTNIYVADLRNTSRLGPPAITAKNR